MALLLNHVYFTLCHIFTHYSLIGLWIIRLPKTLQPLVTNRSSLLKQVPALTHASSLSKQRHSHYWRYDKSGVFIQWHYCNILCNKKTSLYVLTFESIETVMKKWQQIAIFDLIFYSMLKNVNFIFSYITISILQVYYLRVGSQNELWDKRNISNLIITARFVNGLDLL